MIVLQKHVFQKNRFILSPQKPTGSIGSISFLRTSVSSWPALAFSPLVFLRDRVVTVLSGMTSTITHVYAGILKKNNVW